MWWLCSPVGSALMAALVWEALLLPGLQIHFHSMEQMLVLLMAQPEHFGARVEGPLFTCSCFLDLYGDLE
ncbi:UNVERIFIED_CONTAM: hypothetical protein K2H54_053993 [Gekko kuhli]